MSKQLPTFAALLWIRDMELPQGEKLLLYAIASRLPEDSYTIKFPREILMADTGIKSPQSFAKHVQSLEEKKLIRVGKHSVRGSRWPQNSYELLVPPKFRVKKISGDTQNLDSESDTQNLSVDSQNLSVDSQKMDTNNTFNNTGNNTVEDNQQDEISDPASGPQTYEKFLQGEQPETEGIHPDVKKIDFAARFPVASKFNHHKLTSNAKVGFWHSCIAKYRPEHYDPDKSLTGHQSNKLWELFGLYSHKPQQALAVIEWAVTHWEEITGADEKDPFDKNGPPINPTPTYIVNHHDLFTDHLLKVGKVKLT